MFQWIVIKAFQVQMRVLKSKNYASVMLQVDRFLKNLFEQMDIKQHDIILQFLRIYRPEPLKSLF